METSLFGKTVCMTGTFVYSRGQLSGMFEMLGINGHELVVLLLGNLMRYGFSVYDGCHPVLHVALLVLDGFTLLVSDWLDMDVINLNFSAMASSCIFAYIAYIFFSWAIDS